MKRALYLEGQGDLINGFIAGKSRVMVDPPGSIVYTSILS